MAYDNNVVRFSGQQPPQRFSLPPAMVRLRDASGQSLKSVLASFFDRADDALFELADRAGSNTDQTAYFDAMRELRLRRKAMVVSVLQHVSQAFNDIGKFKPRQSSGSLDDADQDSLSLVDHSQLEQQVAIDNLINKLRNRYTDQIRLLTVRVAHLVPRFDLADSQMPLSPEVICGGVAEACSDLDIDIRAKLVVLKLFDRLLADTLGDFYQEANRTLIEQGVMPEMKRPPVARSGSGQGFSGREVPASKAGSFRSAGPDEQGGSGAPQPTFSELSALLHQGAGSGGGHAASGEDYLDTDLLMARLSEIQTSSGQWGVEQVVALSDQLKPVLKAANGRALNVGQVDSDVINLVAMLFDFILEDRQLHPVMKSLISRLQIPVLKVALSDKTFFNRGGHPVRKLLNELALSAIGWSEKRAGQRDPLREKIETVVDRVLSEFADNIGLFEELLTDFRHFMDLDRRRRELVEQRLRDAEEGRAKQERASEAAEGLVRDQLLNRDVPEPVSQLLQEPWSKYLQWVVLREGEDSERWKNARDLTERLVWSVDPRPVTDSTRSDLLRAIPSIVDELRKALLEISWDPFATDSAIRDLELVHVDVFQRLVTETGRSAAPVEEPTSTPEEPVGKAEEPEDIPEPAVPETVDTPSVESTETVPREWLDRADNLRVGSWVELSRDGGKVRCKLAAFIKATGKYIFVNRSGAKVAEYHRHELGSAMAAGDISMLDDGLIFDRALESIIDNLRSSRKD
ncbi:hypothetical protein BKP64_07925 [Marinobacter salinus]|uniref:Thymidine phosphorylase n=1 Tax=Marinobacter salinus TaxID=1874317 RepID=A0A1D9GKD3_9GAMM|nr:DUF1631 domain-containing protein [Marinobacter salinus]AOY88102.1 hypothetical protein BKP64_07925 [Marinobacter salinus]